MWDTEYVSQVFVFLIVYSGLFAYFAMDEVNGDTVIGSDLHLTLHGGAGLTSAGKKGSALHIRQGPGGHASGRLIYSHQYAHLFS